MFDRRGDRIETGDFVLYPAHLHNEGGVIPSVTWLDEGEIIAVVATAEGPGHEHVLHVLPADGFIRRVWPEDTVLSRAGN